MHKPAWLRSWRVVNQQANEAERALFEASLKYLRGDGPPPKETDRAKAAQLRSEAKTLFARALAEVDASGLCGSKGKLPSTGPQNQNAA